MMTSSEIIKVVQKIGDGVSRSFVIPHPSAPNVLISIHDDQGAFVQVGTSDYNHEGVIVYFSRPPKENEFTVVVIG